MINEYVPCPKCGSTNVQKMRYTWWGGAIGPSLLTHVRCQACGYAYNGKTGNSNTPSIIIYSVVVFVIFIIILVLLRH